MKQEIRLLPAQEYAELEKVVGECAMLCVLKIEGNGLKAIRKDDITYVSTSSVEEWLNGPRSSASDK